MAYKLTITESANQDIDNIFFYILNNLCNPKAAIDLADDFHRKYDEVGMNPYMFEESRDISLKSKGYRRIPVQNYVILYKVIEKDKEVVISRIFYCGQNYSELL